MDGFHTLDAMLNANQEIGDKDNIFGAGNTAIDAMVQIEQESGTNIVDYNRYASIPETQKIDYNKLTSISDKPVYKVQSVQETIIKDDGSGGNITKETINYKVDGDKTNQLQIEKQRIEEINEYNNNNDNNNNKTENIDKVTIIIQMNDGSEIPDKLNLSGISGNTTISIIKSLSSKLNKCTFYDEENFEITNLNSKLEAVAEIDGDKFILNAKIMAPQSSDTYTTTNQQHGYTETVVVRNDIVQDVDYDKNESPKEQQPLQSNSNSNSNEINKQSGGCCIIL